MNAPLKQSRYRVEGMDCASCATKIDTAVRRVEGVQDVSVSVTAGTMTIRHAANSDLANLEKRVTGLGYKVSALAASTPTASVKPPSTKQDHADDDHTGHDHDYAVQATKPHNEEEVVRLHGHDPSQTTGPWWRSSKGMLAIASGVAFVLAYAIGTSFPEIVQWAFIAAMLVGLIPIARRAFMAALNGTPFSIEMLMTIAAVGAVFINAAEEAAAVVFLFLIGELLEGVAAGKARSRAGSQLRESI